MEREDLLESYPEEGEVPFSSERRMMATFHRAPSGEVVAFVKGAPGRIVAASKERMIEGGIEALDEKGRETLLERNRSLASRGLRVLALATRPLGPTGARDESALADLTFVGYVGLMDPPAEGAAETIGQLHDAGVRTIMITGDQAVTATAVARQLGVLGEGEEATDGRELGELSDADLAARLEAASAFSRVAPEQKLRIVQALQSRGEIVAMLGDGVNDAPALKRADIGVAMGGRGTDVAKETADVVLQDDRFESIGVAVREGRVIFDNIRKFIFYLFSCNLSEVLVLFVAGLAGLPLPLLPLQILWLNLVTDVFPALALAVEPPEPDVMKRPPRDPRRAILSGRFLGLVGGYGAMLTGATLGAFLWAIASGEGAGEEARATTVAFMALAMTQLLHVFNARARGPVLGPRTLFANRWIWGAVALTVALQLLAVYLDPLASVLGTVPLGPGEWGVVLAAAALPLAAGQGWKALSARSGVSPPRGP
jgi:Ca2+-transporting ATPase